MSWQTIFWIAGTLGAGGLVAAILFFTGLLPVLMANKYGRIIVGIATLGIGLVVAYFKILDDGARKEREKQDAENRERIRRRAEIEQRNAGLSDDAIRERMRRES